MTAAAAWTWAKEHKHLLLLVGVVVAAFFAGRFSARQPSVHQVATETAKADAKATTDTSSTTQSERITDTWFAVGPGFETPVMPDKEEPVVAANFCRPIVVPGEDRIIRQTVTERGPTTTETHAQSEQHQEQASKLELTLQPQGTPGWAVQVGLDDVLAARTLRLAARRRLFGQLWVEVAAVPSGRQLGVGIAYEF